MPLLLRLCRYDPQVNGSSVNIYLLVGFTRFWVSALDSTNVTDKARGSQFNLNVYDHSQTYN